MVTICISGAICLPLFTKISLMEPEPVARKERKGDNDSGVSLSGFIPPILNCAFKAESFASRLFNSAIERS
jgi:hypothetical protein